MAKDDDINWSTCNVGCSVRGGGNVFRKTGGILWIVAPSTAEHKAPWPVGHCTGNRNGGAVTNAALSVTGRSGWFIPDLAMLQTACSCRTYWDTYQIDVYWSSTEKYGCPGCAYARQFNGAGGNYQVKVKPQPNWQRPMRVICY